MEVLKAQEPLAFHPRLSDWLGQVRDDLTGRISLERIPVPELAEDFARFLEDLRPSLTDALIPVHKRLSEDRGDSGDVLSAFLREGISPKPGDTAVDLRRLVFFPHAFMMPIAEVLADRSGRASADTGTTCPVCGWAAVVSVLKDEPDGPGRRRLQCSLCSNVWRFPRLTCSGCRETDAEKLEHHVSETWPHVRIDACATCSTYIKTIDLRTAGDAVPMVDDIASIELDVWANGRGLSKPTQNLLGL